MATGKTDVGTDTRIAFATSGFTADLLSLGGADITREVVETTHMETATWRTYMPGDLTDPGSSDMEIAFDPDDQPPITGAVETITITFPVPAGMTNGATRACSGFVSNWSWGPLTIDERMTASITIKWTGAPAWGDAT